MSFLVCFDGNTVYCRALKFTVIFRKKILLWQACRKALSLAPHQLCFLDIYVDMKHLLQDSKSISIVSVEIIYIFTYCEPNFNDVTKKTDTYD